MPKKIIPAIKDQEKVWSAYSLALNLGYMIVIPILIFGVGGVLLDKYLNSFPIFVLIGFFLAMTSSLLIVYMKTKEIISKGLIKPKMQKFTKPQKPPENLKSNNEN